MRPWLGAVLECSILRDPRGAGGELGGVGAEPIAATAGPKTWLLRIGWKKYGARGARGSKSARTGSIFVGGLIVVELDAINRLAGITARSTP